MILQPGIYHDIAEADYHADPAPEPSLSSSVGRLMLDRSPAHAWHAHPRLNPDYEPDNDTKFSLGKAAHQRALEHDVSRYAIVRFKDYRTNAAKNERDRALGAGRTPILEAQWEQLEAMELERRRFCLTVLQGDPFARTNGDAEVTIVFKGRDIYGRARVDFLPHKGPLFWDYKTTSEASFDKVERKIFDLGYDFQAAFYAHAIGMATDEVRECRWLFQETEPPYACALYQLDEEALRLAANRVAKALQAWRWCLQAERWPSYPPFVGSVRLPPYLDQKRMVQEDNINRILNQDAENSV